MAHRLTVSEAQAASIGLLVRHTSSKYPILYDPVSGINLKKMEANESIDLGDTVSVRNLLRLQDQGCCTLLDLFVVTSEVVGGTADIDVVQWAETGEIVTVTISNLSGTFSSIAVVGDSGAVATTEVTAGEVYTFPMPAEVVTVTVTLV